MKSLQNLSPIVKHDDPASEESHTRRGLRLGEREQPNPVLGRESLETHIGCEHDEQP